MRLRAHSIRISDTNCIVFNATYDKTEKPRWKALQNYERCSERKKNIQRTFYYHELARSLREFGYTILNAKRGGL